MVTVQVSHPELTDYTCKKGVSYVSFKSKKPFPKVPLQIFLLLLLAGISTYAKIWSRIGRRDHHGWFRLVRICLGWQQNLRDSVQTESVMPKSGAGKLIFPSCGPTTLIHRGGQPQRIATCMPGCPGNLGCRWVRGSWTCAQAPHCGWRVTVECGLFLTDHGMEEGSWDPALGRQDYTQVKAWSLECIHHCFIIFHLKIQMQRSIY